MYFLRFAIVTLLWFGSGCLFGSLSAQNAPSAVDQLLGLPDEAEKVQGLLNIITANQRLNPDSAIAIGAVALPIATQLGDESYLQQLHSALATSHFFAKSALDAFLPHADRAIELAKAQGNTAALAQDYRRLLTFYRARVGQEEALELALPLYDRAVREEPAAVQAAIATALGRIYQDLRSGKAFEYNSTAMRLARASGDTSVLILALNQAASSLYYVDSTDLALALAGEAIPLARAADPDLLETLYNLRGLIHGARGHTELAVADFDRRLEALQSPPDLFYYANIGQLFWQNGNLDSALVYYDRAAELVISDTPINYARLFELRRIQVQAALSRLNDQSVYEYWALYSAAMDSLRGRELVAKAQELEARFATERQAARIDLQENALSRQRTQLYTLIGALLLALLAGFILYNLTRRLRQRNAEVEDLATQREALVGEVYHRVKNNLQVISSLLELQREQVGEPQALAALRSSQTRVEAMGLIHERLYGHQHLTSILMPDYLEDLGNRLLSAYSVGERIDLYCDVEEIRLGVDTAILLGLIVNELVANSLKHGYASEGEGTIEICLYQEPNQELVLQVSDDGVGVPSDQGGGAGFGSQLIQLLTDRLGGQVTHPVDGEGGHRTRIVFHPAATENGLSAP